VVKTPAQVWRTPENRDIVDPVVSEALESLSAPLEKTASLAEDHPDRIELGIGLLARDVLESLNNTLKRIAEIALAAKTGAGKATGTGARKLGSYEPLAKFSERGEFLRSPYGGPAGAQVSAGLKFVTRSI
jgi:hypothetical protein